VKFHFVANSFWKKGSLKFSRFLFFEKEKSSKKEQLWVRFHTILFLTAVIADGL
jgi:hypothetical protein